MLGQTTKAAIKSIVHIAAQEGHFCSLQEIVDATHENPNTLAKLLQQLVRHGIISSQKGPNGGFYITDEQQEASLGALLSVLNSPLKTEQCVLGLTSCNSAKPCPLHSEFVAVKKQLDDIFNHTSIKTFALEHQQGKSFLFI